MKLCLALDLASKDENLILLNTLRNYDNLWVKVGLRSFIRDGISFLESIRKINNKFHIFLDLKLYDIPNTMADAAQECSKLEVDMITIHTSSGSIAMQTLMQRLHTLSKRPLVFGVTALTSFEPKGFEEVYARDLQACTLSLAKMAYNNGLDGVVCSVLESKIIKKNTEENFLTLTPGIRPFNENSDDQQRIGTIQDAFYQQSDFIVIGRPIYRAKDPQKAVASIYEEIKKCKS